MAWVWKQETNSSGERLVLLALADHAGEDGECYPSSGSLGRKCSLDPKTVQRHLTALHDRGLITKLYRRKRSNGTLGGWMYRVNVDDADNASAYPLREDVEVASETPRVCPLLDRTSTRAHESSISNRQNESSLVDAEFDEWWSTYPRKTGKQSAVKAWEKLSDASRQAALSAIGAHVEHWQRSKTQQQFIPHPATWLNGRRWEDQLVTHREGKQAPGMSMVRQILEEARSNAN